MNDQSTTVESNSEESELREASYESLALLLSTLSRYPRLPVVWCTEPIRTLECAKHLSSAWRDDGGNALEVVRGGCSSFTIRELSQFVQLSMGIRSGEALSRISEYPVHSLASSFYWVKASWKSSSSVAECNLPVTEKRIRECDACTP
jgi:hypothetical protein